MSESIQPSPTPYEQAVTLAALYGEPQPPEVTAAEDKLLQQYGYLTEPQKEPNR